MTNNEPAVDGGRIGIGRRPVLYGAAGTALAVGGIAGVQTAFAGREDDEESKAEDADTTAATADDHAKPERLDGAFHCDVDMDLRFSNHFQLDGDPSDEGRANVVHVTTHEQVSPDYPCTVVDLQATGYTLGDVSEAGTITYDYFAGRHAENAIPDEVFLILQTADGERTDDGKRTDDGAYFVTYRTESAERSAAWQTRDVSSELTRDGWRAVEVQSDEIDVEGERVLVTTEVVEQRIGALTAAETYADVVDRFGEDATLVAIAMGAGALDGTVTDHYFHGLQVHGESYVIPAVLSMDSEFTPPRVRPGDGTVTVTLSFANPAGQAEGLTLEDVDGESVRMAPYASIAPPLPGTAESDAGITAQSIRQTGRGVDLVFDAGQVRDLLENDEATILVYGAFAVEEPYTFLATGEIQRGGRGN